MYGGGGFRRGMVAPGLLARLHCSCHEETASAPPSPVAPGLHWGKPMGTKFTTLSVSHPASRPGSIAAPRTTSASVTRPTSHPASLHPLHRNVDSRREGDALLSL